MGNLLSKLRNSKALSTVKLKRGSGSANWELKELTVHVFTERLTMNVIALTCSRSWTAGPGLHRTKKTSPQLRLNLQTPVLGPVQCLHPSELRQFHFHGRYRKVLLKQHFLKCEFDDIRGLNLKKELLHRNARSHVLKECLVRMDIPRGRRIPEEGR